MSKYYYNRNKLHKSCNYIRKERRKKKHQKIQDRLDLIKVIEDIYKTTH